MYKLEKIQKHKTKRGFAALMTVIIFSGIISTMLMPMILKSHISESGALNRTLKQESRLSAESCATAILMYLLEFGDFSERTINAGGIPNCEIHSIQASGDNRIIKIESRIITIHTLLQVTIHIPTQKITSIEEVKTF